MLNQIALDSYKCRILPFLYAQGFLMIIVYVRSTLT